MHLQKILREGIGEDHSQLASSWTTVFRRGGKCALEVQLRCRSISWGILRHWLRDRGKKFPFSHTVSFISKMFALMTRKPIAEHQSVVTVHGPGSPWPSDDIRWSEAYWQHWVPMWDKNLAGPFQSKAHLPLQLYDLYLERYLPAAEVCGAQVDCTCLTAGDCAPHSLREGAPQKAPPGYDGYDGWTTHGPSMWVTFLTAILQVLPVWLHTSLAPLSYHNDIQQIYPLKSRSLSTFTNYTP